MARQNQMQSYQVMKNEFGDISGLNAQVSESFGAGIDGLVDKFSLNLIGRCCRPPYELVEELGDRFHDYFWKIYVSAFLENFLID